ncbi:MAG: YciI family protein [Gammaproteobacteria bacterium]|nr:YciI family protein [Gammaproteobacteria bacterium]MDH3535912.1 YciI family protein [Gammaproteobacteria bacterium]
MPKFIFAYHGGKMPETEEEGARVMAEWMAWFENMGTAVVDGGNPVGPSSTLHSDGSVSCDGGPNPLSGYSLVNAESIEQATELARGCPILKAAGSVEIAETFEM